MSRILQLPLQVIECEQNSPEWLAARRGVVTASAFKYVLAKGEAKTRAKYLRQKVAELLDATPAEGFSNSHTERGHILEPDAINLYAFQHDIEPIRVGFMRRGPVGCSPDLLVGDDGMAQVKTLLPELLVELLETEKVPTEHTAQLQGELWVSGRKWTDFIGYWPGLPLFVKRVYRDELFMAKLAVEIEDFLVDVEALRHSIHTRYLARAA